MSNPGAQGTRWHQTGGTGLRCSLDVINNIDDVTNGVDDVTDDVIITCYDVIISGCHLDESSGAACGSESENTMVASCPILLSVNHC